MESILLLLVFAYPGALTDMVYSSIARNKDFYKACTEPFRVARDFFISAMISAVSGVIALNGRGTALTLRSLLDCLTSTEAVWDYLGWSVSLSIAAGFAWYLYKCIVFWCHNSRPTTLQRADYRSAHATPWHDFVSSPDDIRMQDTVVIVRDMSGETLCCGFPWAVPEDVTKDSSMVLIYEDIVKEELSKPKSDSLIDGSVATYCDLAMGKCIELRDATRLIAKLHKADESPSPVDTSWWDKVLRFLCLR